MCMAYINKTNEVDGNISMNAKWRNGLWKNVMLEHTIFQAIHIDLKKIGNFFVILLPQIQLFKYM